MNNFGDLDLDSLVVKEVDPHSYIPFDIGKCDSCGKRSLLSKCHSYEECESWELPDIRYTVYACPHCDEGEIDDFDLSFVRLIKWEIDKFMWSLKKRLTKKK